jgi:hypothetical protein
MEEDRENFISTSSILRGERHVVADSSSNVATEASNLRRRWGVMSGDVPRYRTSKQLGRRNTAIFLVPHFDT